MILVNQETILCFSMFSKDFGLEQIVVEAQTPNHEPCWFFINATFNLLRFCWLALITIPTLVYFLTKRGNKEKQRHSQKK